MDAHRQAYERAVAALTAPGAPYELGSSVLGGIEYRVYRNAPASLAAIYAEAARHGEREFVLYQGERWSFARLLGQAGAIAARLACEAGIRPGDRVAIAMRNCTEWMSAFIGITAMGAIAVPLNSWGTAREIGYALRDCGARLLFCDRRRGEEIAPQLVELGIAAVVARPGDAPLPAGLRSLDAFLGATREGPLPDTAIDPEAPALMMYTSGTTGRPKGALSTHRAVVQSLLNIECSATAMAMINPAAIAAMQAVALPPVQMLAVPLFHVSGCHAVFLGALRAGRRIVMMYKWEVAEALRLIAAERVTILSASPSMLQQLFESPLYAVSDTASLKTIGAGGSASPRRLAELIDTCVPDAYPGAGWGMTESNSSGTAVTGEPLRTRPGCAGFAHPVVEIEARDAEGRAQPPGVPGALWIKSPTLAQGYWQRPEANASAFRDGWFDTGDIGCFDADGYLWITGRAKDMVIRGGENIYPAEIEAVLLEHPAIDEAAAFGLPDAKLGEQLAVVVHAREGAVPEVAALHAFAAARLAHFKLPQQLWIAREPLPRNAAGKVVKHVLREEFGTSHQEIAP
jgi:acyl-CoA synthetase (AMP-forming)/AMP-acid ligase II